MKLWTDWRLLAACAGGLSLLVVAAGALFVCAMLIGVPERIAGWLAVAGAGLLVVSAGESLASWMSAGEAEEMGKAVEDWSSKAEEALALVASEVVSADGMDKAMEDGSSKTERRPMACESLAGLCGSPEVRDVAAGVEAWVGQTGVCLDPLDRLDSGNFGLGDLAGPAPERLELCRRARICGCVVLHVPMNISGIPYYPDWCWFLFKGPGGPSSGYVVVAGNPAGTILVEAARGWEQIRAAVERMEIESAALGGPCRIRLAAVEDWSSKAEEALALVASEVVSADGVGKEGPR